MTRATAAAAPVGRFTTAIRSLSGTDILALIIAAGAWTGLARAAIGAPWYAAVLDVAVAGLAALVAVRQRRDWRQIGLLGVLVLGLVAFAVIEILNPNVPSLRAGLEGFRKTAFTAAAFFIVALWPNADGPRFYRIVALGLIPAFVMAIRQFAAPTPLDLQILGTSGISPITFHSGGVLRAFSPTAGPFHLGILAGCALIVSLVALRRRSNAWLLVAILAGVALGLSLTRANLVASLGSAALIAVAFRGDGGRIPNLARVAPPAAAAVLAVLVAVGAIGTGNGTPGVPGASPGPSAPAATPPPTIGDVVGGVTDPFSDKNLRFRFAFWAEFAKAIAERPVVGYGTGAAADGFDHFYAGTDRRNFEPHSIYFKAALEMGILGLFLLLAILGVAGLLALRKALRGEAVGMIAVGILGIFVVTGLTGPMLDAYPANLLFWATCGWCVRRSAAAMAEGAEPEPADG